MSSIPALPLGLFSVIFPTGYRGATDVHCPASPKARQFYRLLIMAEYGTIRVLRDFRVYLPGEGLSVFMTTGSRRTLASSYLRAGASYQQYEGTHWHSSCTLNIMRSIGYNLPICRYATQKIQAHPLRMAI